MSLDESMCIKESNHLLTYDTAWVAGYKCTSVTLYISILVIAVLLQVGRNFVWTKTSQATRKIDCFHPVW